MPEPQPNPVSGRYRYRPGVDPEQPDATTNASLEVVVRVDVDGLRALERLSVVVSRRFPPARAHAVARVYMDRSTAGGRLLKAGLDYLDGDPNLLPGRHLVFDARGLQPGGQPTFTLSFADRPGLGSYPLFFESRYFDPVEIEVDRVENAGPVVTRYHTGAHPNRPRDLPEEELSLASVYEQAGFRVDRSPQSGTIPLLDAGSDGSWSDAELHNAMVTYWSRFAHRPQRALWVLYAGLHEMGESLGGVMFDDIGDHHRQGTAIFTGSFIGNPPPDDPAPRAWRDRMQFWTAIHEMGHAFNLAHSWQKGTATPLGDPWVPLDNQPEARSFMNYPFNVAGGEAAFFADFRFRFTEEELLFMRHAPRRFVQMGHADWFENHGIEWPSGPDEAGPWRLQLRPNREINNYAFLEPVVVELKLTNTGPAPQPVDQDIVAFANRVSFLVQRHSTTPKRWRGMAIRCYQTRETELAPGESLYGAHNVSCSPDGWLIDEPGFYKVRAALELEGRTLVSNTLGLYVAPPTQPVENRLATDYFTEDVARALAFRGVPALPGAMSVLRAVAARCPLNPASLHAAVAISSPELTDYKVLDTGDDHRLRVRCHHARASEAASLQAQTLTGNAAARAADTFGHIGYFQALDHLAGALLQEGDREGARGVLRSSLETMKQRGILAQVIHRTDHWLNQL
ncbi:MAG: hypothetical protein ACOCVV_06605 [Marinobacter sp.]